MGDQYYYFVKNKGEECGLNSADPEQRPMTELHFSDYCCDIRSPDGRDGRDVPAGLTNWMVYQRYLGGFLVFFVCGVRFRPV
jgi:hypothetical protein